ncbi:PDZ domain-containing protein [Corynebacterium sp. 13CS0277]|uniref:YlbL family protein n=1 Tax=Corynebacterium sp. 13CS0277 TaxID=2071994 RepID=UPI000D02A6EF|nr:PDZ domain-containing protein [Corynebacterium sp. 13CS0277]PRQ11452.1 PDZ domain-containing protein [Corynebacterium sp. 13CS0277]
MNRRFATLLWGFIPVAVATTLITSSHVPGTDIELTVPLAAEGPGPVFNTLGAVDGEQVVSIEGVPTDATTGTLYMTTVAVRHNMPLSQALSRWLTTDDTIVPLDTVIPQNSTADEVDQQNKLAFASSEHSATVAALRYLNKKVTIEVADTVPDSPAAGVLATGDQIVAVDGQPVETPSQVQKLVMDKKPGEELEVTVLHDGVEQHHTVTLQARPNLPEGAPEMPQLGVLMKASSADGVEVEYNLEDVGGPSAGLVFSLTVIDKLTEEDLLQGHTLAGTGTITGEGEIGPIGGITHKIAAAADAGAEAFLVPKDNCAEARRAKADIPLIEVTTLSDAVSSLRAFRSGGEFPTC